jgi:putative transposase
MTLEEKRACVDPDHPSIPVARQCELLGLSRSSCYYASSKSESAINDDCLLMRLIDEQYTAMPFYGSRRMCAHLRRKGHVVNRKRVVRLMRTMGIAALYPKKRLSIRNEEHHVYPYLLKGVNIDKPDQVWATDITYIPVYRGYVYLVAIMDWYSRYVLSWELSRNLEADFCVRALTAALSRSRPSIFNSDQGSQFTSSAFTGCLEAAGVTISMDGRGRCFDNIMIERLWRSVKYEDVYLRDYADYAEAHSGLSEYFAQYNDERLHQSLGYLTPAEVYFGERRPVIAHAS